MFRDEGRAQGAVGALQQTLMRQLRLRFGELPAGMEQTIQSTRDSSRLDQWLNRFATASNLDEVGIGAMP
jgi:hypothetical protein